MDMLILHITIMLGIALSLEGAQAPLAGPSLSRLSLCVSLKPQPRIPLSSCSKKEHASVDQKKLCEAYQSSLTYTFKSAAEIEKNIQEVMAKVALMPPGGTRDLWNKVVHAYKKRDVLELEKLQYAFPDVPGAQLTILFFIVCAVDQQEVYQEDLPLCGAENHSDFLPSQRSDDFILYPMSTIKKNSLLYKKLLNVDVTEKH